MKIKNRHIVCRAMCIAIAILMLLTVTPMTVFAEKTETKTYKTGDIIEFGSYPQSEVTDSALKSALTSRAGSTSGWTSYNYYISGAQSDYMKYTDVKYGGAKYRGVYFTQYRPWATYSSSSTGNNSWQDENGYNTSTVYWFKYEPMKWQVLSFDKTTSNAVVLSRDIIDSQQYYNNTNNRTIGGKTVYSNNYEYSDIRAWLNGTFYDGAFTTSEKNAIIATTLDNSAYDEDYSHYDSNSTTDKVWLLSYSEAQNTAYGFTSNTSYTESRQAKGSAYAFCQGLCKNSSVSSRWRLRSAGSSRGVTCAVSYEGFVISYKGDVRDTDDGVRPALKIHLTCAHTWQKKTTLPTCTKGGYTNHFCTKCSASYKDNYTNALGHDWGEWTVTTPMTCATDGIETRICKRDASHAENRTIKATGQHTEVIDGGKPASCTENGLTDGRHCSVCNAVTTEQKVIPALGHDMIVDVKAKEPTCIEAGNTAGSHCTRCDYKVDSKTIPALGHNIEKYDAEDATCTEKGNKAYVTCSRCDYTTFEETPALGHDFTAEKIDDEYLKFAATCAEKAVYYTSCVRCGLSSMGTENEATFENGEALGHNWGGWKSNEDGTHTRACARDGSHTETADCSASSPIHTDATCTENAHDTYTCEVCGYVWVVVEENSALGHDEIHHDAKAATCTEKGNKAYVTCSRCDYTTYEETPALGHDEIHHDAKAATCTEKGNKAYVTCSRCDYTTYEETPALGHDEIHHDAKAATCTEKGNKAYVTCSRCEYTTYEETPALGHDEIHHDAKAATCTEKGNKAYVTCSRCDYTTYEETPALGHDEISHDAKTATCTEKGNKAYVTCSRCDYTTFEEIPALGHDEIHHDAKAVTCTEKGNKAYVTCSRCEYTTYEETPALGHDEIHHDAKAATCTEKGNKEYLTCSRCEYTTYEETPALGHDEIHHDAKAATCTEKGNKEYLTCSRCDYTTFEEIPALGHIEEVIPAVAANCVHTGLTEGKKCIRCKEILVEQQVIAKTAHTWDNGTVTREPQVGVAGEKTFTCTVCSATRTEEIAPLVPSAPDRIEVKSSDSAKELTGGIVGATHSVTVSELLASSNASFVVDKDGNRVTDTAPLATGMKIILESGGERLEKVISVLGDVNGDGEISVSDARGALRAAVGLDTLEGAYLNAARVNGSTEVAVSDARSILRAAVALDTGKDWLANIK